VKAPQEAMAASAKSRFTFIGYSPSFRFYRTTQEFCQAANLFSALRLCVEITSRFPHLLRHEISMAENAKHNYDGIKIKTLSLLDSRLERRRQDAIFVP
jgi:hypothetical protein